MGGQLVAGMDVPVASREASGAAAAEVMLAEEVPEESGPGGSGGDPDPGRNPGRRPR